MRVNKFIASSTKLSRRAVDQAINSHRVMVNNQPALIGQEVTVADVVTLDNQVISQTSDHITIMLNKPVGYVVSRDGQGSKSIYDLLPLEYVKLKPVGRLDKDSSGLLLLTSDGQLAYELTHPKFSKEKVYEVRLDSALRSEDRIKLEAGVKLSDGLSKLSLEGEGKLWTVRLSEGRNRQIRRSFAAVSYKVVGLHRTKLGSYKLDNLASGQLKVLV
jgi:pseudouridine synthase